jgi:hypothetical protein
MSVGRSPAIDGTSKRVLRWICVALFVLAVLPYLQTLRYEFVNFDDEAYVAENPLVQQGLTWSNVAWAFTTMSAGNWHPLTWLSHMLDCQIFGLRPGWHHFVNALFHGMNTVMLFIVLRGMTSTAWRSALVAALFAVHPLHVESVAWISERKDLLSTFFGLVAIWAYVRYARAPSLTRYGWVGCFFGLSLLSKPMLVTLPFVFLLLDVWPLKRFWIERHPPAKNPKFGSLFFEKLPLLALSAASSIVTFKAQHAAGAVAPIDVVPLSQRLANAIAAYLGYLYKTFWPVDLAVFYPRPDQPAITTLMLAILVIVGITIGVGVFGRTRSWLAMGWLWFLGTLVPVIGLVQVGDQSMADRYAYVPLIGVFIMIAWGLPAASFPSNNRGQLTAMVVALPVIVLGALTFWQVRIWKNTETLFGHALKVTEGNFLAHNLVAGALGQQGDLVGAREHVEKALQLKSNYAGAHYNLGMIMLHQRDFAKALEQFNLALQTKQQDPMIWNGLGMAKAHLGRMDEARAAGSKAIGARANARTAELPDHRSGLRPLCDWVDGERAAPRSGRKQTSSLLIGCHDDSITRCEATSLFWIIPRRKGLLVCLPEQCVGANAPLPAGHDEPNFLWPQLIVYDLRQSFHCRHQRVIAVIRQVIEVWLMLLGYHQRVAPIDGMFVEKGKRERILEDHGCC